MNTVYKVHFTLYYTSLTCIHVFAHNFLNIQQDFQSKKSFRKLRIVAFQPYHPTLCVLKHVGNVGDVDRCQIRSSTYIGFDGMAEKP